MKLSRLLPVLSLSAAFLLPLQSMTPREAENAREKSARLFNKERKRQESAEYKKLNKKEINANFLEAAQLRKKLLEEIDDAQSANDLLAYFQAYTGAYTHAPAGANKRFKESLEAFTPIHQNNANYKRLLWELNSLSGRFLLPGPTGETLSGTDRKNLHLALGEQILKGGVQNMSEQEFGQFLFDFALALAQPQNEDTPAYALFHKKTDWTVLPAPKEKNEFSRNDARLTDAKGNPLTYSKPASWEEARNDGERISYLLAEAEKFNPALSNEIKLNKALWLQHAFFPRPANRETWLRESSSPVSTEKELEKDLTAFFNHLISLSPQETLLHNNGQYVKTSLPESLDYSKTLRELALLPLSDNKKQSSQNNEIKEEAASHLLKDLVSRLKYEDALKLCREIQSGLPANDDSSFKENLAALDAQLSRSGAKFSLIQDSDLFAPDQPIQIPILFRTPSKLKLTVHELDPAEFARAIEQKKNQPGNLRELFNACSLTSRNNQLAACFLLPESGEKPSCLKAPVQTLEYTLTPVSKQGDTLETLSLPPLKSGYYLLQGQTGDNPDTFYRMIAVSDLSLNGYQTKDGYTLSLRNRQNGLPAKDATISVTRFDIQEENSRKKLLATHFSLKTDDRGLCTFPVETGNSVFLFSASDGKNALYHATYISREKTPVQGKKLAAEPVTDRPVYRPGQTVHWNAWVGESDWKTGGKPLKNTPVTVNFGSIAPEQTLTTDERGMTGGAFILPENAKLGSHTLSLKDKDNTFLGGTEIRIEEYKKFEFHATLDCGKKAFLFGEIVPIKIQASYYSGEPVTSGSADVTVQFDGKTLSSKKLPLNEKGEAFLSVDIPRQSSPDSKYESLSIKATISDASLRQVEESLSLPVTTTPFTAQLNADLGYARADQRTSATVKLFTHGGEPVAAQGEAILYKLQPGKEGEEPLKEKILSWTIATNEKGTARLTCIPPTGGLYQLETIFPANNEKTEHISDSIQLHVLPVSGAEQPALPPAKETLTIIPEKRLYKTGETAQFLIIPPTGAKNVELTVSLGFPDEKTISFPTPETLNEFTLPITSDNAPTLDLQATAVKSGSLFFDSERISITRDNQKLTLTPEIMGDKQSADAPTATPASFHPGDTARLKVRVMSPDGQPLQNTPVLMTVYDKALEAFLPYRNENQPFPQNTFWNNYREYFPNMVQDTGDPYRNRFSVLFPTTYPNEKFSPFFDETYSYYGFSGNKKNRDYFYFEDNKRNQSLDPLMGKYVAWKTSSQPGQPADKNTPALSLLSSDIASHLPAPDYTSLSLKNKKYEWLDHPSSVNIDELVTGGLRLEKRKSAQNADSFSEVSLIASASPSPCLSPVYGSSQGKHADSASKKNDLPPLLRSQFADLLKWSGPVITNEQGIVELPLQMPDNLTTWQAVAWSIDDQLRSGTCTTEFLTTQDLIAQLQTPRFLVERDTALLTAVLRNNTDEPETVEVSLQIDGDALSQASPDGSRPKSVVIPAKGSATAQWEVLANKQGSANLTLSAKGQKLNDASKTTLPVILRGAIRGESSSKTLNPGQKSLAVEFTIPEKSLPQFTQINVNICPGFAPVILRALPFLSGYPYGCTEQGLNKFIPSLIVRKTFRDLNIAPDAFLKSQPQTLPNPLADEQTLNKQIEAGLRKLADSQNGDGGWSWFPGGISDTYITAQVLHGLTLAGKSGIALPEGLLDKAFAYLDKQESQCIAQLKKDKQATTDDLDVLVRLTLHETGKKSEQAAQAEEMTRFLIRDKADFTPYSLVNLARYLHARGEKKSLANLLKNLDAVVETNPTEQTARLALAPTRSWWNWENDDIETQAAYLNLLTALDPKSDRTRAVARGIALNRENSYYWKSTRDTALAIEALCNYITAVGEQNAPVSLELKCDGKTVAQLSSEQNGLAQGELTLSADLLPPGKHTLELVRSGTNDKTPVYFSAGLKFFSIEDTLAPSGNDLTVSRKLYKLTPATDKNGTPVEERQELKEGDTLKSGDLLDVELEVNAAKDYQYLMLRDPKTAGCEPFNLTSGYASTPRRNIVSPELSWYMEPADRETRFFLSALPKGKHSLSYKLRVERPGVYIALPAQIEAMYAPILRGSSAANSVTIAPPEEMPEKSPEKTAPAEEKTPSAAEQEALPGKGDETSKEAFEMAFRIRNGWGEEMDSALAIRWMRKAARDGYAPALLKLADWLEESREKDFAEIIDLRIRAIPLLLADQDKENGEIPAALGRLFLLPDSSWKNGDRQLTPEKNRKEQGIAFIKKADELFAKAAEEGSGYAAFRRAKLYEGEGIMRSPEKALQYYEQGAMTGYAPALYEAARLLPDNEKSEAFLRQAVSAKFHPAAELLAERLFARRDKNGIPAPDNVTQALKLLQTAAEGGGTDAQLALSELHKTGKFVPQDEDKAEFWSHKGQNGAFHRPAGEKKSGNSILDAINGKNVPDHDIPALSTLLGDIPLPDELPNINDNLQGKTDGELLSLWKNGNSDAAITLAKKYSRAQDLVKTGPALDKNKEVILCNTRAREGSPEFAFALAELLLPSLYPEDRALGKAWLEFLSRQNYAPAQARLARLLSEKKQPEKAIPLLAALAERHDLASLAALEKIFFETGDGAELNLPRAAAYKAQRLDTASPDALPTLPALKKSLKNKDLPPAVLKTIIQTLLDKNADAPQAARGKLRQILSLT